MVGLLSAEVLKVDAANPEPRVVRYAASWLNRGAVIAVPTDTLYALAADPVNLSAIEEIFRVKGRPESRALPILINSLVYATILAVLLIYRIIKAQRKAQGKTITSTSGSATVPERT